MKEVLSSGSLRLAVITHEDLPEIHSLMTTYRGRPMDFADATLVHLAARESLSLILTIDHDDFETYRIGGRKKVHYSSGPGREIVARVYEGSGNY